VLRGFMRDVLAVYAGKQEPSDTPIGVVQAYARSYLVRVVPHRSDAGQHPAVERFPFGSHPVRPGQASENRIDLEDGEPTEVELPAAPDEEAASEVSDRL
jgi:hypothetical protein